MKKRKRPLAFQASRRREKEGKTFSLSPPSLFFLSFAAFLRCTGSRETQIPSVFKTKKKLKKTKQDPTHVYLALEFVRGGEFFRHLRARGRLPEAAARAYAAEVVVALEAMHDRGIVYRDLKVKKRVSRFSRKKRITFASTNPARVLRKKGKTRHPP